MTTGQTAVVHTSVVILAHSHTWEMGFDTTCPLESCALPGERVGAWGEKGAFSRREMGKHGDSLGGGKIRALGTSPRRGMTPRCPKCLSPLPARVCAQLQLSGSGQGLSLRFSKRLELQAGCLEQGSAAPLYRLTSPPKNSPWGSSDPPTGTEVCFSAGCPRAGCAWSPSLGGGWHLAWGSHARGVSASRAGGSSVTVTVSASRMSHPRVAWPSCSWGWRVDWGHEDKIWCHLGAWQGWG